MAQLARVERELALPSPVPYWQYKRAVADSIHGIEPLIENDAPTASPEPQFAYCFPYPYGVIATGLCLEGRFIVTAIWDNPYDAAGTLPALGVHMTTLAGYFFFDFPGNPEIVIKELNACRNPTPAHWIFASGMTNFFVEIAVRDLATGAVAVYRNPSASNFNTIIDQNTPFLCP